MPVYEYKGFDSKGKAIKGLHEAESPKSLRAVLKRDGILTTDIKESGNAAAGKSASTSKSANKNNNKTGKGAGKTESNGSLLSAEVNLTFLQRISVEDIGLATRQIATLLQAGVPLVDSLTAIIEQVENPAFKSILAQTKADVNEGMSLANALGKHKIFDKIYVNMVRAGESSGTLDIVLERLADFKEGQAKLRNEISGKMMYPIIMMLVAVGLVGVLFVVVVPRITRIFEHAKVQLPLQTRILIFISESMRDYWWALLSIFGLLVWWGMRWMRTEAGIQAWDRLSLRLPIFGSLLRMLAVARFSRTLATLLASGVNLLTSLDIVRNVVNNSVIAKAIDDTRDALREGEEMAAPLKRSKQFPPMVIHMIAVGEKSGQLENMLHRVATAYEQRVETRVQSLTSLLEPLMILGMGSAIGFIVFSILTPILQMNTMIK